MHNKRNAERRKKFSVDNDQKFFLLINSHYRLRVLCLCNFNFSRIEIVQRLTHLVNETMKLGEGLEVETSMGRGLLRLATESCARESNEMLWGLEVSDLICPRKSAPHLKIEERKRDVW